MLRLRFTFSDLYLLTLKSSHGVFMAYKAEVIGNNTADLNVYDLADL